TLTGQDSGLHQRPDTLLQKKRIAFRTRNQELGERRQAGVVPEQGLQEFVRAHWWQRVQPQLGVVGLRTPVVLVLGPVVDQEQQSGGGQTLNEAIEQGLGL